VLPFAGYRRRATDCPAHGIKRWTRLMPHCSPSSRHVVIHKSSTPPSLTEKSLTLNELQTGLVNSGWQKDRASIDWDRAGKSNRHFMVLNCDSVYGLSSETKGRLWLLMTPRSARRSATGLERMEAPRSACKVSSPGASPAWGHVPCSAEPSPRPPAASCSNASCTILHDATAPQRQLDCCTHRLRARCAACSWL
jgi:hypothetical protein